MRAGHVEKRRVDCISLGGCPAAVFVRDERANRPTDDAIPGGHSVIKYIRLTNYETPTAFDESILSVEL